MLPPLYCRFPIEIHGMIEVKYRFMGTRVQKVVGVAVTNSALSRNGSMCNLGLNVDVLRSPPKTDGKCVNRRSNRALKAYSRSVGP